MTDILIRQTGRAGRITLTRPNALNALSYPMCREIDTALRAWTDDSAVELVVMDAEGEKAFCAGGDIAEIHATASAGNYDHGRDFWRDEYRMNARIAAYPKPVVSFLHGFTMGGGVGIGCHGSHRVVGETTRIAMPECGIGLIPDVGGTWLLARAPGRIGAYLGITGARMAAADALLAGFADHFIPLSAWPDLIARLEQTGDASLVAAAATDAPDEGTLAADRAEIDRHFGARTIAEIRQNLVSADTPLARRAREAVDRNSPLSMACTLEAILRLHGATDIREALRQEYRFTYRSLERGDLLEGIRAAIIDKDRTPKWRFTPQEVTPDLVDEMLAPLGAAELEFADG
ncbi:enoyl-CoA hydratase/isomerase family protein [Tropicimonas isoalkanivorans]|uniref:3-hydroxyisobutyryl-CoA hydrolase n=1 Tax=Tropicimonas isoalkanivorans TaxID=441112 RepID=A0A1I1E873_9RHOB|nr:enoyl-CoA hydratase/isomerase family protein [Tropicimonas isoalkanivorans]SFB81180.1 Enoyl-CoA hydratase/carnithine racemase [Tropicimonas isoalkanivorans]